MSADAPVRDRVASATNAVLKLASDAGASDLVERITVEAQLWSRPEVTVLVAGETQSGKSSLVNSLLGRQVLPTGEVGATGKHVVVRFGSDAALVHLAGAHDPHPIPLRDLAAWLGPASSEGHSTVRGADLQVESPALSNGLVLVDTPGLGSVDDAGGRITLAALSSADALLFVVDAGRPISARSLAFLEGASSRIDTVLIALTKIDRFRGWRQLAADDRSAITQVARGLAQVPIVPVSNRLKAMSDEMDAASAPDLQLRDESGVPRLSEELRVGVVDRRQVLRLSNLLRVDRRALADLAARVAAHVHADSTPSAVQAAVDRDQAELEDLRVRAEQTQIMVVDGFAALRDTATAEVNLALRDLAMRLEEKVRVRGAPPLADVADLELRAIDAELSGSIDAEAARLAAAAGELLAVALDVQSHAELGLPRASAVNAAAADDLAARLRVSIAGAVASSGTGMALFASRAISPTGPDILLALFGATAAIGVVVTGLNLRMMKRQADLQTIRREIQAVVETVRTASGPAIRQRVLSSQRDLEAAVKSEVRSRTRTLQQSIADGTRLARADAADRQKAAAAAQARQAEIERLGAGIEALSAEVAGD